MGILMWDKPEKVMSTEAWMAISADSAPPGIYVPNMSEADRSAFKAKLVRPRKNLPMRVEIRKSVSGPDVLREPEPTYRDPTVMRQPNCGAEVLIVVTLDQVRVSQNGPAAYDYQEDWIDMIAAVQEARKVLKAQS